MKAFRGGGGSTTNAAPSAPPSQTVYLSARHSVPIGVTIKHARIAATHAATLAVVALLFSAGAAWADAPITECDRLAAHPYDLRKITEGVDWDDLDADKAIPDCQEAVNNWPTEVRLQYRLARAFQKAGRDSGVLQILKKLAVDLTSLCSRPVQPRRHI